MGQGARKRLAELLDHAQQRGDFSTRIDVPAGALRIDVDGLGELQVPLRAPVTRKTDTVFTRERKTCAQAETDLAWLRTQGPQPPS